MKIFNILKMKEVAAKSITTDWLKNTREVATSKSTQAAQPIEYEKLPSIPLKYMQGTLEEPEILVVKQIQSFHPANKPEKTPVGEIEVIYSDCKRITQGKYNMWFGYKILNDELQAFMKDNGEGPEEKVEAIINDKGDTEVFTLRNIDGQTYVIAMCGETTPKKGSKNRPAKIFRVFLPPT